jgi:hypothetical protein
MKFILKGDFEGHPFRGNQWTNRAGLAQLDVGQETAVAEAETGEKPVAADAEAEHNADMTTYEGRAKIAKERINNICEQYGYDPAKVTYKAADDDPDAFVEDPEYGKANVGGMFNNKTKLITIYDHGEGEGFIADDAILVHELFHAKFRDLMDTGREFFEGRDASARARKASGLILSIFEDQDKFTLMGKTGWFVSEYAAYNWQRFLRGSHEMGDAVMAVTESISEISSLEHKKKGKARSAYYKNAKTVLGPDGVAERKDMLDDGFKAWMEIYNETKNY